MFGFVKKAFFTGLTILSSVNLLTVTPLKCISMTNQKCKLRPEIVNVNSDEPVFYPFSIKTSKSKYQWSICKYVCSWYCKNLKC